LRNGRREKEQDLAKEHFLITVGATREAIDPSDSSPTIHRAAWVLP
jgi:hypothetical protein